MQIFHPFRGVLGSYGDPLKIQTDHTDHSDHVDVADFVNVADHTSHDHADHAEHTDIWQDMEDERERAAAKIQAGFKV